MTLRPAVPDVSVPGPGAPSCLISICIPTYNRAHYLAETLESLIPQLAPDVELLVYDTGSTDGSRQVIERFAGQCPALRYFSLPSKRGFDETVLLLLDECRGEYVWLFGSDDILKPGAVSAVRGRIVQSSARPAFIYVNHEVIDNEGELLIASNVGSSRDRQFRRAGACAAWLGLHLGYISSCIFRKPSRAAVEASRDFIGTLWMGLRLNLASLSEAGPALYVGRPLVSARRNPANTYDYAAVFVRNASSVFWAARSQGLGWFTPYRAMNKTVRSFYSRLTFAWRCDDPPEFRRTFRVMLRTCWIYPWFWMLIAPLRFLPPPVARVVRDRLRSRRGHRNRKLVPREFAVRETPARLD
jgi:glycosyltransferase involved in cell wall biosynthesis